MPYLAPISSGHHFGKQREAHVNEPRNGLHQVYFQVDNWNKGTIIPAFSAMGDVGGFTPTAGLQKINVLDRPQHTGNTVYAGFDPYTATLPLVIDTRSGNNCWSNVHFGGGTVEDIWALLEWMGGVGLSVMGESALKNQTASNVARVGPIAVKVKTLDNNGNPTNVIPVVHQQKQWLITDLEWGDRLRDGSTGNLNQAKVIVTLEESVSSDLVGNVTARFGTKLEWHRFKAINPGRNTPLTIVQRAMHVEKVDWVSTAKAIMAYSQNSRLNLRTIHSKISPVVNGRIVHPQDVWIPKGPVS